MFVHTYFLEYAIIINVNPPIHYIVFATPQKNEIPSPERASHPAGSFILFYACISADNRIK